MWHPPTSWLVSVMIMASVVFTKSETSLKRLSACFWLSGKVNKELKKTPMVSPFSPPSLNSFGFINKTTCSKSGILLAFDWQFSILFHNPLICLHHKFGNFYHVHQFLGSCTILGRRITKHAFIIVIVQGQPTLCSKDMFAHCWVWTLKCMYTYSCITGRTNKVHKDGYGIYHLPPWWHLWSLKCHLQLYSR